MLLVFVFVDDELTWEADRVLSAGIVELNELGLSLAPSLMRSVRTKPSLGAPVHGAQAAVCGSVTRGEGMFNKDEEYS